MSDQRTLPSRHEAGMWCLPFTEDNHGLLPSIMRAYRDGVLMTAHELVAPLADYEGRLYCPLHRTWLVPPDAFHADGTKDCEAQAVDPYAAMQFMMKENQNE